MKKILNIIKTHYIVSSLVGLVLIGVGYGMFRHSNNVGDLYTVVAGDVVQRVEVTGKTKPVTAVDLAFENSGKVVHTYVDIGSRVTPGDLLATLDQSALNANLLQAQANVESEQARLDELKSGTRPEELAIAQTSVDNAKTSVSDAQNNLSAKMLDGYTKSDDAIHNSVDQLFSNPRTSNPQFNLLLSDSQLKSNLASDRIAMESLLTDWNTHSYSTVQDAVTVQADLSKIKSFIDEVASAVNSQTASANLPQSTLDGYKAALSSARSNIVTAITNMTAAVEKYNTAQATLVSAQKNLSLKQVGNTTEDIRAQEARVLQNQAQVENVQAQLNKLSLRSPLARVVTRQDAKTGEIVTPGTPLISIISDNNLEIEAAVSEINIGKVVIGNPVDITLDAFPGQTFNGTVTYIDPAETLIDGIVNYKVKIAFAQKYSEIKSGLTTNLSIRTGEKQNALRVPEYALIKKDSGTFVSKKDGKTFVQVPVSVGIVGQDGYVEITSGVNAGDVIQLVPATQ